MRTGLWILAGGASIVVLAGVVGSACGDVLSYDATIPWTATDFTGARLSFPKFNVPGATLTRVTLGLQGQIQTTLRFTSGSDGSTLNWMETDVAVWVQDPKGQLTVTTDGSPEIADQWNPQLLLTKRKTYSNPASMKAGDTITASALTSAVVSDSESYTNLAILNEFRGMGNVDLSASTHANTALSYSGANGSANQQTTATVIGTVTYEYIYNAVPEVGTLILGGCVVVPLMTYRRRAPMTEVSN